MSKPGLRAALLREMGIRPMWRLRGQSAEVHHDDRSSAPARRLQLPDEVPRVEQVSRAEAPVRPRPRQETGRAAVMPPPAPARIAQAPRPESSQLAGLDWEALEDAMRVCTACALCKGRRQVVPGVGLRSAQMMFVGEGPGVEEDRRGEPFVGPAGKLLDSMLASIGLSRNAAEPDGGVYIANAVKCHPPHNRTPAPEEIQVCHPFLARQIDDIAPARAPGAGDAEAQAQGVRAGREEPAGTFKGSGSKCDSHGEQCTPGFDSAS